MLIEVTLIAAAACAILNAWLGGRIVRHRIGEGVLHGDGGREEIQRRMRAQANFVENAPFFLILVAAIELARGPVQPLWVAVALFLIARIAHAIGMDRAGRNPYRFLGTAVTLLLTLALAGWAVVIVLEGSSVGIVRLPAGDLPAAG